MIPTRINMFRKSISLLNCYSRRSLSVQKKNGFDWKEQEKILMEPLEYQQITPCKHHPLLPAAFNHWLQVPEEKFSGIKKISDDWTSWIILVDDMQDDSAFRYGVAAAHHVFGMGLTISAVNKSLIVIQRQVKDLGDPRALEIFTKRMEEHIHGQGIDIYWRENYICPTIDAHIEMTKLTIGSTVALPVELMQLFSNNKTDYTGLAINVGAYYVILDNYYNLFAPKTLPKLASIRQENHVTCSDITECKMTLPVIHASQFPDVATELAYILKQRTSDPKLQNRVIALLKKHGSDVYTRETLRKLNDDIRTEIEELGGNPLLTAYMDDLSFDDCEPEADLELYS